MPVAENILEEPEAHETFWSHGLNKCKQQPLVPLGIFVTCGALLGATRSLRSGNRAQFQKYLRLRVAAQGVTIVAAVAGTLLLTDKATQTKEARTRALTGQVPPDPDSISSSSSSLSTSLSSTLPPPSAIVPDTALDFVPLEDKPAVTPSHRGKISIRALRKSGAMEQAEREEGGQAAPMRASDFSRRLSQAEKLQAEMDNYVPTSEERRRR